MTQSGLSILKLCVQPRQDAHVALLLLRQLAQVLQFEVADLIFLLFQIFRRILEPLIEEVGRLCSTGLLGIADLPE